MKRNANIDIAFCLLVQKLAPVQGDQEETKETNPDR